MRTFRLQFRANGAHDDNIVEFEGDDPHEAFTLIGEKHQGERVHLYEGDRLLSVITRISDDRWEIGQGS